MNALIPHPGSTLPGHSLHTTSEYNDIPPMTDPLGKHWEQPADIRLAPMDDTHVILSRRQIEMLRDYNSSYPSGTYDGKCWLRTNSGVTWLCWYYPHDNPKRISIGSREVLPLETQPTLEGMEE